MASRARRRKLAEREATNARRRQLLAARTTDALKEKIELLHDLEVASGHGIIHAAVEANQLRHQIGTALDAMRHA